MTSLSAKQRKEIKRLHGLFAVAALGKSGFGGVDEHGMIVDRRKVPGAVPMAKNTMLGIPKPKAVR